MTVRSSAIVYSADGERLISASDDGEVVIRDGVTGAVERRLRAHEGRVTALALDPGGVILYSAGSDPLIAAWDLESGEAVGGIQRG